MSLIDIIPTKMRNLFGSFTLILLSSLINNAVDAQNAKLTGKVVDNKNQAMAGVYVVAINFTDSDDKHMVVTNPNGYFTITGLDEQLYNIRTSFVGYRTFYATIKIAKPIEDLGIIKLVEESKNIEGVTITGNAVPAIQKGDTVELNAGAFKTNVDANAEDLVKKMPGITVDNAGTVKAQGEDVKKVLVDGKPFFGDDPTVALKNLPAEVIDKVQIYSKLSEQAELTGFDDGNTTKTMNIVTKANSRNGKFGKAAVGYNGDDKYLTSGNLNIFKGQQRLSVIGLSNNINQQNFSMQDILGSSGGSRGGMGGRGASGGGNTGMINLPGGSNNFFIGQQNGISSTNSIGFNYSDAWGDKININLSYFFNNSRNTSLQVTHSENLIFNPNTPKYNTSNNDSRTTNFNHRFNMRFEYQIDSMNTLVISPRLSFQTNNSDKTSSSLNTSDGAVFFNSSSNSNDIKSNGYNLNNELVFRHKFSKTGRTFSIGLNTSANNKTSNTLYNSTISKVVNTSITNNTKTNGLTDGYTLAGNFTYTEPLSDVSILQFNYTTSYSKNDADKKAYDLGLQNNLYDLVDSLSNLYKNDYLTNRAGLSYRLRSEKGMLSFGMDYQRADLNGDQTFPNQASVEKSFSNFLPNLIYNYKFSKKNNLRLNYRSTTNAPSISQLQNVVDNSNSIQLSSGNPNLKQEYRHTLMGRYSYSNPEKATNFFLFVNASYTLNNIGDKTIYAGDTPVYVPEIDYNLGSRSQITIPINTNPSYNINSMISYGFLFKPIKSNITLMGGAGISENPGYVNTALNKSKTYAYNNGIVIGSNISEKVDFTLSYSINYNVVKNSNQTVSSTGDYNYWNHTGSMRFTWSFWKGFVLQNDLIGQLIKGLSEDYNQEYLLWNISLAKKLFKSQNYELKLSANDILNQNRNIYRTVTSTYIQDTRNNVLGQYFIMTFTYNLRPSRGDMRQMDERRRRDRDDFGNRGLGRD